MLNKKIGWIGLGRMGTPMVQKLLKKGKLRYRPIYSPIQEVGPSSKLYRRN